MSSARLIRRLLLGVATLLWLLVGGEGLCRFEGDWRLDRAALTQRPRPPADAQVGRNAERALLAAVTYQQGVDPAWFFAPPAAIDKPASALLQARTAANPTASQQENYLWNDAYLAHADAHLLELLRGLKVETLFAFPSYDGSWFPLYRLYPDNDYRPTPWITNHWGWLSPEVTVRKPPHIVRVGIIGDSTSHNRYGFYLQGFLDAWAQARGLDVRFEVLNSARQGFGIEDGLAALRYELGPMGLDYVYEYFAPNFSLNLPQMVAFAELPPGVAAGKPPERAHPWRQAVRRLLDPVASVSALARRLRDLATREAADSLLTEPAKPRVKLHLPAVSRGRVMLAETQKDPYFATLAGHLDRFRELAASLHATPLVSTVRLCAWDGMVLRNGANRHLYDTLNGPLFWPFSYADLRRMLAVHNGVIDTWARESGVAVVDIDGRLPRRAELCSDAHHDLPISQQLRAWLIFQALLPLLAQDLAAHSVPRDNADSSDVHPYLDKPIEVLDRSHWLARMDAQNATKAAATQ
jgi:hypothetical protein